mmetsp:Transcript_172868/g.554250  ORF Transcript_172868/g.554250 Transcript_172868/m.554250 type:complete len:155 (-) Transcript_172868:15-479(-)
MSPRLGSPLCTWPPRSSPPGRLGSSAAAAARGGARQQRLLCCWFGPWRWRAGRALTGPRRGRKGGRLAPARPCGARCCATSLSWYGFVAKVSRAETLIRSHGWDEGVPFGQLVATPWNLWWLLHRLQLELPPLVDGIGFEGIGSSSPSAGRQEL